MYWCRSGEGFLSFDICATAKYRSDMSEASSINNLSSKCAILIPTRNRPERLRETLSRLREEGLGNLPLWVYDDCSDDPQAVKSMIEAGWAGGQVVRGEMRVGQAQGRNVLLRACQTDFAIMLDDDQYFLETGNLNEHILSHADHSERSIVQFQSIIKGTGEVAIPKGVGPQPVSSFMGGSILAHVPSILKVGGYRDFFVYGSEEPDLVMRLWAQGFQVWYDPSIVVEHNQSYSAEERRDLREYDYLYARNILLLHTMNMPLWVGLPVGIARSARRLFYRRRGLGNYAAKTMGLLSGICTTFSKWSERTPLPMQKLQSFWRFSRAWNETRSRNF
jgi:GT2 family glycosyltransferase